MSHFSKEFLTWLDTNADHIDQESGPIADQLLEKIAENDVFKIGVPAEFDGLGGGPTQVVDVLDELAQHSLTASFISWGHRTFIEYILASDNAYPRETWLKELYTGERAGGTGLSNAVKFLSDIEELNVTISQEGDDYYLDGRLPWVTNLRSDKFAALFAADFKDGSQPWIITIPSEAEGLSRSEDLEFVSLQGANTASLTFDHVKLDPNWVLSKEGTDYIAKTRPNFLGFQFGLAFGLAKRSLDEVEASLNSNRSVLREEFEATRENLLAIQDQLFAGLNDANYFIEKPRELFQLRIDIVDVVANSLLLELQASGGRGYLKESESSFLRVRCSFVTFLQLARKAGGPMKVFFKKIPLALSSLVLALFSLSNQINHYALIAQGIWFLASIGFMLILGRLILGFEQVREDLHNPVIASAFASYFMAAFLFASRLPLAQIGLSVTWVGLLGLYIAYIIFFSLRFLRPFSLNQVYPSWFVVYVGPAISLVTVPASVPTSIKGLILGVTGLATLSLFPLVLWRMRQIAIPHLYQPILAILAAPLALLITSSIKSNQRPATIILLALLLFSQAFFFYALNLFVKLVRKGFMPLFAAFSFPLVNSVNAFKAATTSLGLVNPATQLIYKVEFVIILLIMTYLLYHFLKLLYKALIQALHTKKEAGSV